MGRIFGQTSSTQDSSQGIGRLSRQGYLSPPQEEKSGFFESLKKLVMPSVATGGVSGSVGISDMQDKVDKKGDKTTSFWTPFDYLLNTGVYAGAGALESGFKKAKDIKTRKDAGEKVSLSEQITAPSPFNPANWEGALENLKSKNRKTAFDITREQLPDNPLAAGVALAGDIAAPTAPIGRIAKAMQLDKVASAAGNIPLVKKAGEIAAPIFKYRGGQPTAYADRAEEAVIESQRGMEKGKELAEGLTKGFSQAEQQRMGQIMKGGVSVSSKEERLRKAVEPAREELDRLSRELVDQATTGGETLVTPRGLAADLVNTLRTTGTQYNQAGTRVSKTTGAPVQKLPVETIKAEQKGSVPISETTAQTINANIGKYMPRLYRKYEKDPEGLVKFLSTGKGKVIVDRFKNKKDIPMETRQLMGEILEPGYPVGKAVAQLHDTIAKSKLFRWVSDNFAQTQNTTGDLVQIAPDARYGLLAGKFVPKSVADDLQGIVAPRQGIKLGDIEVEKIYDRLLGAWKTGKVVLNPASLARNQMSNMVLMNVVGQVPMHQVLNPKLWIDAGNELKNQGGLYRALKNETDLLSSGVYGNEIAPFLDTFSAQSGNAFQRFSAAAVNAPGNFYSSVEQIGKIAMVKYLLEEGKTLKEAAKIAEDTLFNYRKVPKIVAGLRKFPLGYPFITFAYKATPAVVKAVANRPQKIAQLTRVGKAVEAEAEQQYGEANKSMLPNFMQGQYLRLPFQENGEDLYLDLNYILPWGSLSGFTGEPQNPAFTLIADINRNKSSFTDKEIWKETDDDGKKVGKAADYIYKALMPSLAPGIPFTEIKGGYSWQKLVDAGLFGGQQRPDYFDRLRNKPTVLADVLAGLKMTPVNYEQTEAIKQGQKKGSIRSLQEDIRSTSKDNRLFPDEKKSRIKYSQKRMQEITEGK